MKSTLIAVPALALVTGLSVAACNSNGSGSGTSTAGAHAKAEASALQNSGTTRLTEKQAQLLAAQCLPGDATSSPSQIVIDLIFHPGKRHTALECAKIPRSNWQLAANCLVTQHKAHPIPKADATLADKQARHQAVVNTFAPCVLKYHAGAKVSPSAVPSASPKAATTKAAA
jgi:hypothetical protein